jgi:putative ABC transport system substrate-binding protein
MKRRTFVGGMAAVMATPFAAKAQQAGKVYRVGILTPGSSPPGPLEALREGLHDHGYIDGKNLVLEWRFAEGQNERLPGLARELVGGVGCIVAVNTPAAKAAKSATTEECHY